MSTTTTLTPMAVAQAIAERVLDADALWRRINDPEGNNPGVLAVAEAVELSGELNGVWDTQVQEVRQDILDALTGAGADVGKIRDLLDQLEGEIKSSHEAYYLAKSHFLLGYACGVRVGGAK